ncbi:MAG: hypothetical protein V4556_10185 [Bacteroidota bacterium]
MKKITTVILLCLFSFTNSFSQVDKDFNKQVTAILNATMDDLKGELIDSDEFSETYKSKLAINGFTVKFNNSDIGTYTTADFNSSGTDMEMQKIADNLSKLAGYIYKDSKNEKDWSATEYKVYSDVKREIILYKLLNNVRIAKLKVTFKKTGVLEMMFY